MDLPDSVTHDTHGGASTHAAPQAPAASHAHAPGHGHGEHHAPIAPATRKRLPRKAQLTILAMIAAIVVVAFVLGPRTLHLFSASTPAEQSTEAAAPAADAQAFKLTARQWSTIRIEPVKHHVFQDAHETDGKIAIDDDLVTPVFSPYTGRVVKLMARAGDDVARGDPLFSIQGTELAQAQNDLITNASNLRTSRAQLALAQTSEKRQHDLFLAQGGALKDWQQSQVDLATAQGNLNGASIALAAVRNRLRILGISERDIDTIEATANPLQLNAETVVAAPISGTVVQRQIGLGQNIVSASSGATNPVFMIGDLSKVWLVANAREEDAPSLHKGDPVEVSVLAFPGRVFNARLTYVASSIDPNTHRLLVRAEVENPKRELKPEMFARFRIITGEDDVAPGVPESAVVYEGDTAHVWAADPSQKTLAIRPIKVGRNRDGVVEVLSGLKQGDSVVSAGAVFIDRAVAGD
jgi:cobalt-zinc-cadmium efflux system membrane fusion protein